MIQRGCDWVSLGFNGLLMVFNGNNCLSLSGHDTLSFHDTFLYTMDIMAEIPTSHDHLKANLSTPRQSMAKLGFDG